MSNLADLQINTDESKDLNGFSFKVVSLPIIPEPQTAPNVLTKEQKKAILTAEKEAKKAKAHTEKEVKKAAEKIEKEAKRAAEKEASKTIANSGNFAGAMNEMENLISSKYEIKHNILSDEQEYYENSVKKEIGKNDLLRWIWANGIKTSERTLKVTLESSFVKPYNPIDEYFDALEWDGFDHIGKLLSYIQTSDKYWFESQFKKHLVRCVAQARGKIAFNKHCIVFTGKQNDGKTSLVRFLCPPRLKEYMNENPNVDKDGIISLAKNFIVLFDELTIFSKGDISAIKSLLSTSDIKERLPFATRPQLMKRNANFFATTNHKDYLTDETGNVRWIPAPIESINHDNGGANGYVQNCDINGVWAQALALLNEGFEYNLTKDEIQFLEKLNDVHIKYSYEMELLNEYFAIGTKDDDFMTAANIVDFLTDGKRKINHVQLGKALKKFEFPRVSKWDSDSRNTKYGYYVKRIN